jgi:hypothetical protein
VSNRYASSAETCEIKKLGYRRRVLRLRIVAVQRRDFTRFQERVENNRFCMSLCSDKMSFYNDSISTIRHVCVAAGQGPASSGHGAKPGLE